jgi:hypothetical protein
MVDQEKKTVATNLRIPSELHARLKDYAEKQKRSINNQILIFIEEGLDEVEKPNPGNASRH